MDELTIQVNLALDRVKAERGINEGQLCTQLGTNRMQIWRWRHGQFSEAFKLIIPETVLAGKPLPPHWTKAAADIRILAPLLRKLKLALDKDVTTMLQ